MRTEAPFQRSDLHELVGLLFSRAKRVVPMYDVYRGDTDPQVIGLRHDVDDNPGSWQAALAMAAWEAERGYTSTYYLLHSAGYWAQALDEVAKLTELGHEVGIHVNAIAQGLRTDTEPSLVLVGALAELRNAGVRVLGSVAHGDPLCHRAKFVNDEMFSECRRPEYGAPDRFLRYHDVVLELQPLPREVWGLAYDANWLPRAQYLSDSGGRWSQPAAEVAAGFGSGGQTHVLLHPDWWVQAFAPAEVAA